MRWVIYHFISGDAFFSGAALMILGAILPAFGEGSRMRITSLSLILVGAGFVAMSSAPLAWPFYVAWSVLLMVWLVGHHGDKAEHSRLAMLARGGLTAFIIAMVFVELPWRRLPTLSGGEHRFVYVIGDSLSTSEDTEVDAWPDILGAAARMPVINLAELGASTEDGLGQAHAVLSDDALVVVNIGEVDILNGTPTKEFEVHLTELMKELTVPGRTIVQFELPLLPFHNSYGLIQRRIAREYGVVLLPKRLFSGIHVGAGMEANQFRLTQEGHNEVANFLWNALRQQLGPARELPASNPAPRDDAKSSPGTVVRLSPPEETPSRPA